MDWNIPEDADPRVYLYDCQEDTIAERMRAASDARKAGYSKASLKIPADTRKGYSLKGVKMDRTLRQVDAFNNYNLAREELNDAFQLDGHALIFASFEKAEAALHTMMTEPFSFIPFNGSQS